MVDWREFGFGARAEASESEEVERTTRLFRKANMFRVLKSGDKPETYVDDVGRPTALEINL
jgi:hypothetical protein